MLSPALLAERRLAAFVVGHLKGDFRHLFADLIHHGVDLAPHGQIVRAPRRHAAQMLRTIPAMLSMASSKSSRRSSSRFFSISRSCSISVRLDPDVISVGFTARRLPPLAPQVSQIGNAALIEREAVTLPLDQTFGFELADVRAGAIEVQRQCRRADGRSIIGDRHARNCLGHRVGPVAFVAG
jgi:hypothetical protein